MATRMLLLRRALQPSLAAVSRSLSSTATASRSPPLPSSLLLSQPAVTLSPYLPQPPPSLGGACSRFMSTGYSRITDLKDGDEIDENTILFEGCDFNHWLITMDFPKDPKPTPEEMVRTYEETCAKGLNISIEEAKLKMYACSTTTYQGFQAVMTEAESEQFKGLPGVVFILPDSYIDPQNKQYGGDKYENGVITPRPPPVQYRSRRRFNNDPPRYDRQGGEMPNRRGNPQYDYQAQRPPQQNYPPQQNFSPSGQFDQRPQQNYPPQQNFGPSGQFDQRPQQNPPQRNFSPPGQFDQRPQQNYPPQQNFGPSGQFDQRPQQNPPQQNFGPSGQFDQRPQQNPPQQNFSPLGQFDQRPQQNYPPQQNFGPPGQFDQRPQQNYPPKQNFSPPGQFDQRPQQNYPQQNYGPPGQANQTNSMPTNNINYNSGGIDPHQTQSRDQIPPYYGQGDRWNQGPPGQNNFGRDNRNYAPHGGPHAEGADGSQGQVPGGPYGPVDQGNYGIGGRGGRDQGRF